MTVVAERAKNWLDSEGVTRLFKLVAVASLLASLFVGVQQYELTACLAAYNEMSNANTQLRGQAAAEERAALDAWIAAVDDARRQPAGSARDALDRAFDSYREARARIEGKRSVAPIPGPPSQTCG
jgi:hypothetical protein